MVKKSKDLKPPQGFNRLMFRLPIWLYKLKLGWLLGRRFLLLNHTGRKSGLPRQAVLEVVRYDRKSNTFIVTAGFGKTSQWYQNIIANPDVTIQSGGHTCKARAELLTPKQAGEELLSFAQHYPFEARFSHVLGYEVDGTLADYRAMGEMMPFVAFKPG